MTVIVAVRDPWVMLYRMVVNKNKNNLSERDNLNACVSNPDTGWMNVQSISALNISTASFITGNNLGKLNYSLNINYSLSSGTSLPVYPILTDVWIRVQKSQSMQHVCACCQVACLKRTFTLVKKYIND